MTSPAELIALPQLGFAEAWRNAARSLLGRQVPPHRAEWQSAEATPGLPLFGPIAASGSAADPAIRIPRLLFCLIEDALCADVPDRFALPYRLVWRAQTERSLAHDESDPDMARLRVLSKLVRRDGHRMKAFVRFREVPQADARRNFTAWFEPDHFITERTAPFFARRFGDMDWQIETPRGCVTCRDGELSFAGGTMRPEQPADATDDLWRTYYTNVFNPARLKVKAMQAEMPKKYWKNLPEASLIPALIAGAEQRVLAMRAAEATQPTFRSLRMQSYERTTSEPAAISRDRQQLDAEISGCTRCPLHCNATQAVSGEGPDHAPILVVGEQPGDREDLAGRPFVGPAGRELDAAFAAAGAVRAETYLTNAVKHFKHSMRGKRRIHERPGTTEIVACKWWLRQEVALVRPRIIIALGATASLAVTGNGTAITARQGQIERSVFGPPVIVTGHPAAILRVPDAAHADRLRHELANALRTASRTV